MAWTSSGSPRLQVFELPTVLAYPLFYKLVAPESSVVRKDAILAWMAAKTVRIIGYSTHPRYRV